MKGKMSITKRWYELIDENREIIEGLFKKPVLHEGEYFKIDGSGGIQLYPGYDFSLKEVTGLYKAEHGKDSVESSEILNGFYARMSAAGIMDATDYYEIGSIGDVEDFFEIYVEG